MARRHTKSGTPKYGSSSAAAPESDNTSALLRTSSTLDKLDSALRLHMTIEERDIYPLVAKLVGIATTPFAAVALALGWRERQARFVLLIALISGANLASLALLVHHLISGGTVTGSRLVLSAFVVTLVQVRLARRARSRPAPMDRPRGSRRSPSRRPGSSRRSGRPPEDAGRGPRPSPPIRAA